MLTDSLGQSGIIIINAVHDDAAVRMLGYSIREVSA
jgi:hypothetical protein